MPAGARIELTGVHGVLAWRPSVLKCRQFDLIRRLFVFASAVIVLKRPVIVSAPAVFVSKWSVFVFAWPLIVFVPSLFVSMPTLFVFASGLFVLMPAPFVFISVLIAFYVPLGDPISLNKARYIPHNDPILPFQGIFGGTGPNRRAGNPIVIAANAFAVGQHLNFSREKGARPPRAQFSTPPWKTRTHWQCPSIRASSPRNLPDAGARPATPGAGVRPPSVLFFSTPAIR